MAQIRIATYNLWSSDVLFPERLDAACEELARVDADLLALQEVRLDTHDHDATDVASHICDRLGYAHALACPYASGDSEGLALLSKHAFSRIDGPTEDRGQSFDGGGLRACFTIGTTKLSLTNVHLDYTSIATREHQILIMSRWIDATGDTSRYEVLLGDFN